MTPEADIAVVGAGAAGLLAAIAAKRAAPSASVLLLDSRHKIGAKILISGGTRCNVTNRRVLPSDYEGGPSHFVKHVLEAFTPAQTIDFFQDIGVELVLEPTGKYFPTTHSGKTVLEALKKEVEARGVALETGVKIEEIGTAGDGFTLKGPDGERHARRAILATGGLSLPETGSDGTGLRIAEKMGHAVVPTAPALSPFVSSDEAWKSLSGVTLDADLSFFRLGRKEASARGSFLFTHFGFSGPAALDLSRHFAKCAPDDRPEIFADLIPAQNDTALKAAFARRAGSARSLKSFLVEEFSLPARFAEVFLEKNGLDAKAIAGRLSAVHQRKLAELLRRAPLGVTGVYGYKKAEATAGGVDLKEVRVATMESRLVPGLYFAGEILDVDGRIGGFNFQWAWSSGTVAGRAAARSLKP